jgi:2-methylcitrate dehydratase PrpD
MAASMAGGSRQNFGTMTKPLHVGLAAEHGILAATLAGRGFTADPDQLEGPMGFLALFGEVARPAGPIDEDGGGANDAAGLNVKLYPCCYATHAAVDAALELRKTLIAAGAVPDAIVGIDVAVPPGGLAPLIHHRPTDGLQSKFSLEYAVAAALRDGEVILASFEDARVQGSDVQTLLQRVAVGETPNPPSGPPAWADTFAAVVTLRLTDGRTVTNRVDQPAGHATRPVSEAQLRAKFTDCLTSAGIGATGRRYDVLRNLRRQPSARTVIDILTEK